MHYTTLLLLQLHNPTATHLITTRRHWPCTVCVIRTARSIQTLTGLTVARSSPTPASVSVSVRVSVRVNVRGGTGE
jgi:hypothetical protein